MWAFLSLQTQYTKFYDNTNHKTVLNGSLYQIKDRILET